MEERLEKLDQRLSTVERILPTLATKEDLKAFATKDDLKAFATKDDLKAFATKEDLKALATKDDLDKLESRQRSFTEHVLDRGNDLSDGFGHLSARVTSLETETRGVKHTLDILVMRLEAKNVI